MSEYKHNPKMVGSGIFAAIPQKGNCPFKCSECFFQTGRGYLEPLEENTPNMPPVEEMVDRVVRINDGNDSTNEFDNVIKLTQRYRFRFFNTSWPTRVSEFPGPVVLTLNPGKYTDESFWRLEPVPKNLMFVRFRVNAWNKQLMNQAVEYWTNLEVPVILTFMAYHSAESVPEYFRKRGDYIERKRTTNTYWAISTKAWDEIMDMHRLNKWVSSCGKVEGEQGNTKCRWCGNCLREYYATMERLRS
jgi:hypothetical protein